MYNKHGLCSKGKEHPVYKAWRNMRKRCLNSNHYNFPYYGGRGIKICDRWNNSVSFIEDMLPTWKPGLFFDRIDNNGNYEPSNCQWSTPSDSAKNRRNRSAIQSKYAGVSWNKKSKKWTSVVNLGSFDSEEDAAKAYNKIKTLIQKEDIYGNT